MAFVERFDRRDRDDRKILSGDGSRVLWDRINSVRRRKTHRAIYSLDCQCQELESLLHDAIDRIHALETKIK